MKNISKIGMGTYRMSTEHEAHYDALVYGLNNGYNLIDTATNYQQGNAEILIGNVFKNHPELSHKAFVISKAGYIPIKALMNDDLKYLIENNTIKIAHIEDDFKYSIDPIFLNFQIESSLKRLNRDYIDCYMLHNPERYLQSKNLNSHEEMLNDIIRAFSFLEEKVQEGKIKYYGLSSNVLHNPNGKVSINFLQLIQTIKKVNLPNFNFIQFPYNFLEQEVLENKYDGKNVLEIAKENNIKSISNRPLNMNDANMEFRFISYNPNLWQQSDLEIEHSLNKVIDLVNQRIYELTGETNQALDYEPMVLLSQNIRNFKSHISVEQFFHHNILPFFKKLFEEDYNAIDVFIYDLKMHMSHMVYKNISLKANQFFEEIKINFNVEERENYPLTAAHYYLNKVGIDYVLFGMRRKEYLEDLNQQFNLKSLN